MTNRAVRLEEDRDAYCPYTGRRIVNPDAMFLVGETYQTVEGAFVRIVAESRDVKGAYSCVKGSDDIWRYDRRGDRGRVTGRSNYCGMNLVPPREETPWPEKSV